jgi:amino acid efflux transporter
MIAQLSCAKTLQAAQLCDRVRTSFGFANPMTAKGITADRTAARDTTRSSASGGPDSPPLTTARGSALYIGALLGPGLLLLPGLAAAQAGPASILAWVALLCLSGLFAAVFSALGRRLPSAGGVMGYVTAGLGRRAGLATGWSFVAAVVCGAPVVCLVGASYVTSLIGGGLITRAAVAAALLVLVLVLALGRLRASTAAQLILVSVLIGIVVLAITGSAPTVRAANWTPFAPHGWLSVGRAATTLMLSFVGWEAVAPLTTRFADPARQLPRVIGIALAATTALYLSLAIATVGVLGPAAGTSVPLASLLQRSLGSAGSAVAAVTAVVLTLGTTNAYITGAATMAGELAGSARAARNNSRSQPRRTFFAAIAATSLVLLTLYGAGVVSITWLVAVPTTLFLSVYLAAMAAAVIVLCGRVRAAAIPAGAAVTGMLAYCGWLLAIPAVVVLLAAAASTRRPAHPRQPRADQDAASIVGPCRRSPQPSGSTDSNCSTSLAPGTMAVC